MDIKQIFENNKKWIENKLEGQKDYFELLAQGQSPQYLYIGCSDSRVTAEDIMGVEPGDVFVHRNIANLVPNTDINVMSVINYAVVHLHVKHVIVCGHYGCGGVKAAMETADLGILNPWLRNIRDVYRLHQSELDGIADEDARYRRLVELNVEEQCMNIINLREVQKAHREEKIMLHGWVFDIDFNKSLEGIRDIYELDT